MTHAMTWQVTSRGCHAATGQRRLRPSPERVPAWPPWRARAWRAASRLAEGCATRYVGCLGTGLLGHKRPRSSGAATRQRVLALLLLPARGWLSADAWASPAGEQWQRSSRERHEEGHPPQVLQREQGTHSLHLRCTPGGAQTLGGAPLRMVLRPRVGGARSPAHCRSSATAWR